MAVIEQENFVWESGSYIKLLHYINKKFSYIYYFFIYVFVTIVVGSVVKELSHIVFDIPNTAQRTRNNIVTDRKIINKFLSHLFCFVEITIVIEYSSTTSLIVVVINFMSQVSKQSNKIICCLW